jgi:DHA3 family macrolide efflux protein-like MFS transporter
VTWPAFVVDALTFLASAGLVLGLAGDVGTPERQGPISGGTRGAVVEGLRIVAGNRVLWTTLLALAVSMFGLGAVNVLFLPLVVDVLAVSPVWLGAVEAAQSVSMILAAAAVAVLAARLRPTTIVTVTILGIGGLIALTGLVTSVWHVVVLLFLVGWFVTPLQASVVTLMQTGVPDGARGRVMSTLQAAMSGASVASMALAGVFGDVLGIREVFLLGGGFVLVGGVLAALLYRGAVIPTGSADPGPDMPRPGSTPGLDAEVVV